MESLRRQQSLQHGRALPLCDCTAAALTLPDELLTYVSVNVLCYILLYDALQRSEFLHHVGLAPSPFACGQHCSNSAAWWNATSRYQGWVLLGYCNEDVCRCCGMRFNCAGGVMGNILPGRQSVCSSPAWRESFDRSKRSWGIRLISFLFITSIFPLLFVMLYTCLPYLRIYAYYLHIYLPKKVSSRQGQH